MVFVEEFFVENTSQREVVIIDGCSDVYNTIYPIFVHHFEMHRISLDDIDELVNHSPPDAVIMIVGKSQYEKSFTWLRKIRTHPDWQAIPIIPYLNLAEELAFLQAGATDCWVFPTSIEAMVMRLKNHLQRVYQTQKLQTNYQKAYLDQSRLIEIATHDLQHPINDLLMVESLMQQYVDSASPLEPLLADMSRAIDSMQETLSDVLTALNLRGKMRFEMEIIPATRILLDIGLKYTMRASNKRIEVLVGQTNGTIYADPKRVGQILENLVSNAVKYSPPDKQVHIWSESGHDGTYIRVRDWGVGVPPTERDRLFSEFGRLSSQPTGNENSIGLGLWVVKQLAQAMNGDVGASFPDEGGSIFWVRLPSHPPV